jgi:radical SAM superfamily enzyme YgiQ (UPF0313 family)
MIMSTNVGPGEITGEMKIVLADPPDLGSPWIIANHPNLGILYLSGYLRSKKKDVRVHYLDALLSLTEHLKRLEQIHPDLYGLSFSNLREADAFETIRAVKKRYPNLPVLCGGPYPTVMAEQILRDLPVDICVQGEGEVTLAELVDVFREGRSLEEVQGIAFKRNGRVVTSPQRDLIGDLDSVPFPAWDMVDFTRYKGNYQYMSRPSTAMVASRGCPFDCVFCANSVWKVSKPWLRLRSPANISKEVRILYRMGVREISIRSDEFNPVLPWAIEVCRELRKLELRDLFFQANIRADKVNDELAREMKKCNFWLVQLGIESGNQRTLDGIGKKVSLDQIVETCRILKRQGIKVYGYIMIYNAWEENGTFVHETPEDVDRTLDFVQFLKRRRLLDYISFSTTTPMRGSRLFDIAKRHGVLRQDRRMTDLSRFSMALPHVSQKAMKRSRLKGLLLQLSLNMRSGRNCLTDFRKNWHKVKTLVESI